MKRVSTYAALNLAAILAAPAAFAQAPGAGTSKPDEAAAGDIIVTATRSERSLRDAPGSVSIVGDEDFADIGAQTLEDALQTVVGLVPTTSSGRVGSVSLRGTGAGRTLVLIDGRRVANGFRDTVDFRRVLLPAFDRVELVRGPTSALYGSDAVGGVVNIITRDAATTGAEISGRYDVGDANGYQANLLATAAGPKLSALVDIGVLHQQGFDDDTVDGLSEVDETTAIGGLAQIEYRLNERHAISFGGSVTDFERTGLRPVQGLTRERAADDRRSEAFLRYDGGDGADLSWMAQANFSRFNSDIVFDPTDTNLDTGEAQEMAQVEGQVNWNLGALGVLSTGADLRREEINEPDTGVEDDSANRGGFVQLDMMLGERVNLVAGVRGDHHSEFGGNLAPRAALVWSLADNMRVRASYGQAFKAPTLSELSVTQLRRRGREIVQNNPELEPETSEGFELGLEGEVGMLQAGVTGFYNDIENRIDEVFVRTESSGGGSGGSGGGGGGGGGSTITYLRLENIEDVTTYGAEFQLGLTLPAGFYARANATYVETEAGENDDPLANEPRWRSFAKVGWASSGGDFRASLRANYLSQTVNDSGDAVPSTTTFGLNAEYRLTPDLAVFSGVDNLTDEGDAENLIVPRHFYAGLRKAF